MSRRWAAMLLSCLCVCSGTGAIGVVHVSYIKNEDPRVQKMHDHFLDMEPPVALNQFPFPRTLSWKFVCNWEQK